ncbi:MAG TPA: hypothetical protein VNW51_06320, partial [Mucilaginibacter sp.]|nr:hypothetical protein [Mucilaginibacter sp.]
SRGTVTYSIAASGQEAESKVYFTPDSSASVTQYGPANVKLLINSKGTYFAVLLDVPVASMKKVAVLTPDEIDQTIADAPKFTFTPGTETKQISGFNCKKVTVKDAKSGSTYVAWITNDITAPVNVLTRYFAGAGGVPVQFTTLQQGQPVDVTLKSISDEKAPAGTFVIPAGFEKISYDDLKSMGKK